MNLDKLTEEEEKVILKLSNLIYDHLYQNLRLSFERAESLAMKACLAIQRSLENGE